MTDKKDASPAAAENKQPGPPGIQVITQYVKDSSFENPNAPESLVAGWGQPETNVQISVSRKHVRDNLFESALHLRVEALHNPDNRICFIVDLHYGALVALSNVPAESQLAVLMVEVPKLLFPYIREIVTSMTMEGGYPPLYLSPIQFEQIYLSEVKRLKAEQDQRQAAGGSA